MKAECFFLVIGACLLTMLFCLAFNRKGGGK